MSVHQFTSTPQHRVLPLDQWPTDEAGISRLRAQGYVPPIMGGADGDDDGDGDGGGDEHADSDEDDDADSDRGRRQRRQQRRGARDDAADDDADTDDSDDDGDDSETVAQLRARLARERRERQKLERQQRRQRQQQQEAEGEFRTLYEDEKRGREDDQAKFRRVTLRGAVISQASALNAINPERVVRLVDLNPDDVVDDDYEVDAKAVERAIKALRKTDPYLFREQRTQRDDVRGDREDASSRRNGDEERRNGNGEGVTPGLGRIRDAYQRAGVGTADDR